MIEVNARLLPSEQDLKLLKDTFAEVQAACLWVNEFEQTGETDTQELRKKCYAPLRKQTLLGSALCHYVLDIVSTYRRANERLSDVPLLIKQISFYSNGLTIQNSRQLTVCLADDGRCALDFDLPKPEDYALVKAHKLRRGDLYCQDGVFYLRLHLAPTHLAYDPTKGVSYGQV